MEAEAWPSRDSMSVQQSAISTRPGHAWQSCCHSPQALQHFFLLCPFPAFQDSTKCSSYLMIWGVRWWWGTWSHEEDMAHEAELQHAIGWVC